MIFDLKLTKTDLLTIVLLSVLFFSIAAYNVGEIHTGFATTHWEYHHQRKLLRGLRLQSAGANGLLLCAPRQRHRDLLLRVRQVTGTL